MGSRDRGPVVRSRAIVTIQLLQSACGLLGNETEINTTIISAIVAFAEVVDRVVRRGECVELERTFDRRERHLDDARVVAVVVAQQATRIEETTHLPELDYVGVVRIRIESFLVYGVTQLAPEGILGSCDRIDEAVGFVRYCSSSGA